MPILSNASATDASGAVMNDVAGNQYNAREMQIHYNNREGRQGAKSF
jgi:hypothetical protein